MDLQVIQVPFHLGHPLLGMGRGPVHLIERGLVGELAGITGQIGVETITHDGSANEIQASFDIAASIARSVARAVKLQQFPLVLSGNCASCLGTLSGLPRMPPLGVIWFDAHADFNTPATTTTGFFDGMALAIAAGRGWDAIRRSIPAFEPIEESRIALCGARAIDPLEQELLNGSGVSLVPARALRESGAAVFSEALARFPDEVQRIYLHLDLDVLDPSEGRANAYAEPDGFSTQLVVDLVGQIGRRFAIAAAALTAYDPAYDAEDRILRSAFRLSRAIVEAASSFPAG